VVFKLNFTVKIEIFSIDDQLTLGKSKLRQRNSGVFDSSNNSIKGITGRQSPTFQCNPASTAGFIIPSAGNGCSISIKKDRQAAPLPMESVSSKGHGSSSIVSDGAIPISSSEMLPLLDNSSHFNESAKIKELEQMLSDLRYQVEVLVAESDIRVAPEPTSFFPSMLDRGGWLIALLMLQSCSSFILSSNQGLLDKHPAIIYFLTMLVGAGGNAGNQAAVRVIRRIALGTISSSTMGTYLRKEMYMAFGLSLLLGMTGLVRGFLSNSSITETVAITCSLVSIVFISIVFGAILPLILYFMKVDPAHSSTSIQVIMDILGVYITCIIANFLLDTSVGQNLLHIFGFPIIKT
jgi:cation transporter-like permease